MGLAIMILGLAVFLGSHTFTSLRAPRAAVVARLGEGPYKGVYALVAHVSGLSEGHVYSRHHGPRLLSGVVSSHSPVDAVSLLLRRRDHGRCSSYDGTTERFRHARCGTGSFFHVSNSGAFSYLLPAALGRGRYVLDIRASDTAGNQVALARGTSRTVFYVH